MYCYPVLPCLRARVCWTVSFRWRIILHSYSAARPTGAGDAIISWLLCENRTRAMPPRTSASFERRCRCLLRSKLMNVFVVFIQEMTYICIDRDRYRYRYRSRYREPMQIYAMYTLITCTPFLFEISDRYHDRYHMHEQKKLNLCMIRFAIAI